MHRSETTPFSRTARGLVLLALIVLGPTGCVERLLEIRSDPPGADVYVNGKKIADTTPVRHPFTFYGTVGVVLRREGHVSKHVAVKLSPPWYEFFPLDFFAEILVPWTLQDHHLVDVRLEPVGPFDVEEAADADVQTLKHLQERADAVRREVTEEKANIENAESAASTDKNEEPGRASNAEATPDRATP